MLEARKDVSVKDLTSFKIGGKTKFFAVGRSVDDITEAVDLAKSTNTKLFVIGGGSNIIFSDEYLDLFILKLEMFGFDVIKDEEEFSLIKIGATENWDEIVKRSVELGLSGIEAMSAIPGTVGATPVQNVGAYGQEIKDTLVEVQVFDTTDKSVKALSNADCGFKYRDSIFKSEEKGRYIILNVTLKLSKLRPGVPEYPGVQKYFSESGIDKPSLVDIRNAIIDIRKSKLPDPSNVPNVGAFFENPIIDRVHVQGSTEKFPDMKYFELADSRIKVPAGWLIEKAGFKGQLIGNGKIKVHQDNALVLTNNGEATFSDLLSAKEEIIGKVKEMFGIELEMEPNVI